MLSELKLHESILNDGFIIKSSLNTYFKNITSDKYSIKIPLSGSENYKVESKSFDVKDKNFLITNPFQEVIAQVDSKNVVNGLCIYINADIMQDVYFSSTNLFIDDGKECSDPPLILEHTYAAEYDDLGIFINSIKQQLFKSHQLNSNEFFYNICELVLQKRLSVYFQYSKINALKLSTKQELYRRLDTMHQIIQEGYKGHLSLLGLSKEVGLSKFHAIRLYKNVYNVSPYQFIQKLRLEESVNLLKSHTITEVSHLLNFTDRRAFSKAFKKRFGISPQNHLILEP